jgi:uncharacterized phiE125 gp8 family phage protein
MWPTGSYRGGWYGGSWNRGYSRYYDDGRGKLPIPHAVSVCTVQPTVEPLTLDEAKLRAGMTYVSPDERDPLMLGFVKAARFKVEQDVGVALLTQTRVVTLDTVVGDVIILPPLSTPLQELTSIVTVDPYGVETTLDPASYVVDFDSGRIARVTGASWPRNLRSFQSWVITLISGWPTPADLAEQAPILLQAVGLLTGHYANLGRDLAGITVMTEVPQGYCDLIAPMVDITVA